jgi:hypothetical protein
MLDLLTVINGRSWPLTERLRYATGDEVRWRVLAGSVEPALSPTIAPLLT